MVSQRSYKTNLAFGATLESLHKKYAVLDVSNRGNASIQLGENTVQLTTNGFVKIFGGRQNDEHILRELGQKVITSDGKPFRWDLSRSTKGGKESETEDLLRRRAEIEDELKAVRNIPLTPEEEAYEATMLEIAENETLDEADRRLTTELEQTNRRLSELQARPQRVRRKKYRKRSQSVAPFEPT